MRLELGDCLDKLKDLPDNSVDSIVTDPPYGLSFMNKKWDYDVPSTEIWTECLRVLKPGGHLLSFGGSRTYHRMAVRIEDAGFEIRDQIMWIYGSGFPKSHNIGKAVDKLLGNEREVVGDKPYKSGNLKTENILGGDYSMDNRVQLQETKGNTEWEGWGTALKPAHEPIVVARKPLSEKSVAENVIRWGTGGLNIDVSRVGTTDNLNGGAYSKGEYNTDGKVLELGLKRQEGQYEQPEGRWPANIILDEGEEPWRKFFYCPKTSKKDRDEGLDNFEEYTSGKNGRGLDRMCSECGTKMVNQKDCVCENPNWIDIPKKNHHPTVKPTSLMEYLIKLVTPVGGTVMDPFMGSGSTGKGAVRNGFDFIGIEREEEYITIAESRIKNEIK